MPITIPIEGAGDPPLVPMRYAAYMAAEIKSSTADPAISGIDITSGNRFHALGSAEIVKLSVFEYLSAINLGAVKRNRFLGAIDTIEGESFIILADLLQEELSGPFMGLFGSTDINAVLTINGTPVPIKSFSYQVPSGRLGSILNITLAKPDASQVPYGSTVNFSLVVTQNGTQHFYSLFTSGKLQEREVKIAWRSGNRGGPADEITFGALDVLSDKFTLAPRRPVIMFDPNRVRIDNVTPDPESAIRDEQGRVINPVIEPVGGLSMRRILNRAYTDQGGYAGTTAIGPGFGTFTWLPFLSSGSNDQVGMGFTSVITNVPDYKVRRADFSIEGGWHDGAQPVVTMYAPVHFVTGTILFIMDTDRPLPFSIVPRLIALSDHKMLAEKVAFKPDANAVLLTYQYSANDPSEEPLRLQRTVFPTPDVEEPNGSDEGVAGFVRITTRKEVVEWYLASAPEEVLASYDKRVNVETEQTIVWAIKDPDTEEILDTVVHPRRMTHQEIITQQYDGELKIGHLRETYAALTVSEELRTELTLVEKEQCDIIWTDDPFNPGVKVQDRMTLEITGKCYYGNEEETIFEDSGDISIVRRVPVLLAQSSGFVEEGMVLSAMIPIKTIRETLRHIKGRQYDVELIEIDHLNNTLKRSSVEPRTGSVSSDPFGTKSRTVLFRDRDSELLIGSRIPVPVNSYELPRGMAFELARRILFRLNNPLGLMPIDLPGVDFAIARGSVVRGQRRSGTTGNYFVTGFSITGQNLGAEGHRISQSLETTELLA